MTLATKYIQSVLNGEIVVGETIYLMCERHTQDLERVNDDDFAYYFDEVAATQVLEFMKLQKHAKGNMRGKLFTLQGWQAVPLWCVYGWKRKDNDFRRYRTVYIKVARKNGKTEYLAGIGNYGFIADNEIDPEVYWVATKKDQAKIGWLRQKNMIELLRKDSPSVARYCNTAAHRVYTTDGDGFIGYLGRDSDTEDGHSPYYGIIDEYHAHKDDGMVNVITSGMMAREQPLLWIITTAGFNPVSPCALFEKKCIQAIRGQISLESVFPWIYNLDDDDNWEDSEVWAKANPNLGVSLHLHNLEEDYKKAKELGTTYETNFKTKNLNIWTNSNSTWIPDNVWQENAQNFDINDLLGRDCYGGLDLASVRDLCSLCLLFPAREGYDESNIALWWHWVNEEQARERQKNDSVPYLQWATDGYMTLTPGNITDHDYIENKIVSLMDKYNIISVAYDRKMSAHLIPRLEDQGVRLEPFGQGFLSMSAPTKELERLIHSRSLNHMNNPVMRWQVSNIYIERDGADNIKVNKGKSGEKVDGVVSLVMAIGEWMTNRDSGDESIYNNRDVFMI